MNEGMLKDIQDQPAALESGIQDLRSQARALPIIEQPRRVILTGSGDSLIAALAVESLYSRLLDVQVRSLPALDASRYFAWGPEDLVVAISVSGEVSRAIEVATGARAAGATTVAVTASRNSTIARRSDHTLLMPPPIDRSIPHCRDYTLTLAALTTLLESLVPARLTELDAWVEVVDPVLTRSRELVGELSIDGGRTWFLGAGPDRATAMYGAMKFWEAGGLQAWWDDLEEFGHGSQLMAGPGDRVVVIAAGPGLDRADEMLPGFRRMGMEPVVVSDGATTLDAKHLTTHTLGSVEWHPFVSCLPLQILAYRQATERNLDVSTPLFGRAHGPVYEEVHREWTAHSPPQPAAQAAARPPEVEGA